MRRVLQQLMTVPDRIETVTVEHGLAVKLDQVRVKRNGARNAEKDGGQGWN